MSPKFHSAPEALAELAATVRVKGAQFTAVRLEVMLIAGRARTVTGIVTVLLQLLPSGNVLIAVSLTAWFFGRLKLCSGFNWLLVIPSPKSHK